MLLEKRFAFQIEYILDKNLNKSYILSASQLNINVNIILKKY